MQHMQRETMRRKKQRGFTLLELTIAMAIFLMLLGVVAQVLISYNHILVFQRQRNEALLHCRSVINEMRNIRETNPSNFPGAILARFPQNSPVTGFGSLPDEQIVVRYTDTAANPLEVTVTSSWRDLRGRPASVSLSTLLTDR